MKTNMLASARSLSNQDLLDRLPVLAGNERHSSVELVAHLAALQERPSLYEGLGFGSLFEYCTVVLRLSEDAACTRTAVAGACRRFPVILELLAAGATNLTNIRRLAGKLTPENHEAILARAAHKTREEVEILIRELDPLPDFRSSVRQAPAPTSVGPSPHAAHASSQGAIRLSPSEGAAPLFPAAPVPRPVVRPSAPQRYHVKFTIGEETHRKLRRVQTLLRREIPDGDPGVIFDRALAVLLEKVEKTKLGATAKPRRGPSIRPGTDNAGTRPSRHIPSAVKRVVSKRDADQCAFVSPAGRRCTQRAFLEFHHVQPFAQQGPETVENISLRCRAHNVYESELVFGPFDASVVREAAENYAVSGEWRPFRNGSTRRRVTRTAYTPYRSMLTLLAALALAATVESAPLASLSLRASAPDVVLAGESTKVTTTWTATENIEVAFHRAQILLDAGKGFVRWQEAPRSPIQGAAVQGAFLLKAGEWVAGDHVIGVGGESKSPRDPYKLAFPRFGPYRVMVRYCENDTCVASNAVTIRAVQPKGQDAEFFERYVKRDPQLMLGWSSVQDGAFFSWLIGEYPRNRYLARAKLLHYEMEIHRAIHDAPHPESATDPVQGAVPALLSKLAAEDFGDSPFEADRLELIAQMQARMGHPPRRP